jgi:hypothetical protein
MMDIVINVTGDTAALLLVVLLLFTPRRPPK